MAQRNTAQRDRDRRAISRGYPPCWICGEAIDYTIKTPHPDSFEVDHVVALARGGADSLSNKKASHRRCNNHKRAKVHADEIKRSTSIRRPGGDGQGSAKA